MCVSMPACVRVYVHVCAPSLTCPILPGNFSDIPPLETAAAILPAPSTHTAPTVSSGAASSDWRNMCQKHTHTRTVTHTHTHTHTRTVTHTHTHTHTHTLRLTHPHSHTHTHTHTHRHSLTHTHTPTPTLTHTQVYSIVIPEINVVFY